MEIDIEKVLDFMIKNSKKHAEAKAERIYLDEFKKTKKAILMKEAEAKGHTSSASQEREAYAHPDYADLLKGLKDAVQREEELRWLLVAAQAKAKAWESLEYSNRAIDRAAR